MAPGAQGLTGVQADQTSLLHIRTAPGAVQSVDSRECWTWLAHSLAQLLSQDKAARLHLLLHVAAQRLAAPLLLTR